MGKNPLQRTAARTRDQTKLKLSQSMCLVYMKLFLFITIAFEVVEFSPKFSTEPCSRKLPANGPKYES